MRNETTMDIDKIKFLIQSIEVLIDELKSEVYIDSETFKVSETSYYEENDDNTKDERVKNICPQITDDTL